MKEIELIDKRGLREKHFLQENGEFRAEIYDDNIHYKSDGIFKEIDNSLILDGNHYVNKANENKISFAAIPQTELMRIKKDNHFISFSLKEINEYEIKKDESMSKLVSKIKYVNILKNIDISYDLVSSNVKENIYIKDKDNDIDKLEFIIDTDMELHLIDNNICSMDGDKCIFKFDTPYMIDSSGNINKNIKYLLNKKDDKYVLAMILDEEWLQLIASYPVVIDPTITDYNNDKSVEDAYISSGEPRKNFNERDCLKVGVERDGSNDVINRTLIKFDLPTIGTGSQVIKAEIELKNYPDYTQSMISDLIDIHRITEKWDEQLASWFSMNNKYDQHIEGTFVTHRIHYTDDDGALILSKSGANITPLVQKWYTGTPNYGIMLMLSDEVYKSNVIPMFFSKNNSVIGDDPKPILTITYRNQNGLENYMKYITKKFSSGSISHNIYNGNLVGLFEIGGTIKSKIPVVLKLIYNTNDVVLNNDYGYGIGYKYNFHQLITQEIIGGVTYLKYLDEDGTEHYFLNERVTYDSGILNGFITTTYENTYFDEDGLNLVIEDNGNNYTLKDKYGNQSIFTKNSGIGYLTLISDADGNQVTITYDNNNRINKIVDDNNNEINIVYNSNIIQVISPDQTIELNYQNNNLISIVQLDGTIIVNNTNNLITDVTDTNGIKFQYEYYANPPYKLKKFIEKGLNNSIGYYYEAFYEFKSTTIIDDKEKSIVTTFNDNGNPISSATLKGNNNISEAYGMCTDYGISYQGETQYKNKIIEEEIPIQYVKNLLSNTSFESDNLNDIPFIPDNNVSLTTTTDYYNNGFKSLKITNSSGVSSMYQNITVPKGNSYTFSGYFKSDNKSMGIMLMYIDANNNQIQKTSEKINTTNFERYDVSIYYPEDAQSDLKIIIFMEEIGYYYVDDIQLEKGEVANNYNMIENSDFSNGYAGWNLSSSNLPLSDVFSVVDVDDQKALKVGMNTSNTTMESQSFNIYGKAGDVFNVSFWYKHTGLLGGSGIGEFTRCNLIVGFIPVDEQNVTGVYINESLNPNEKEWQFYSKTIQVPHDFKMVSIRLLQEMNGNELYITNFNMFKDARNITYDYDENGNIIQQKKLDNSINTFKYDTNNQLINTINPQGKMISYEYDNIVKDRIIRCVTEKGISNEIEYDESGNPVITRIINRGQKREITDGLYQIRLKGTNKRVSMVNNSLNTSNDCHKHHLWNIEKMTINNIDYYKIKHPIIQNKYITVNNSVIVQAYDLENSVFEFIRQDNNSFLIKNKGTNKYLKNDNVNLIATDLIENDFNFEFYLEKVVDNVFIENKAKYSNDGRFITCMQDSNFNNVFYDIDPVTGLTNSITYPNSGTVYYEYNNKKQIKSVRSNNLSVNYEYNNNNLLSKIIQEGRTYEFIYDDFLNIKNIKLNNSTLITNNYEQNNGKISSSNFGNNHSISYIYDSFERLKRLIKMNDTYEYYYGNAGDLIKIKSNNDMVKYVYDSAKRLYKYSFNNFKIKYGYDSLDNVILKNYKLSNISHLVENEINDNDSISKTTFDNLYELNYNYDALGRLINKNINNSFSTNYEFVTNGKRTTTLLKSINNNNDKYSYKYDKLDNIIAIYHNGVLENRYYYDLNEQLIREDNLLDGITIRYKYNKLGNIISKKKYEINTYNQLSQEVFEYNNPIWVDQLTKINNESITYDNIGNPLTIGVNQLTWINGRQLDSYSNLDYNISYKYDSENRRISKIVNNVETVYYNEGKNIILEQTGDNVLYYLHNELDDVIGLIYNNNIYYYIKNNQNDIIGLVDSNFNIIAKYRYDSWGSIISICDGSNNDISNDMTHIANINPFRYRSYYYDKETNLYYLNDRYYNPKWGRFINIDSYGGQVGGNILAHNMYLYGLNNPTSNSDSNGQFAIALSFAGIKIVGLIIAAVAVVEVTKKPVALFVTSAIDSINTRYVPPKEKKSTKSKTVSKTKAATTTAVQVKADAIPMSAPKSIYEPCTDAWISNNDVVRGRSMTIAESQIHVSVGGNVMCNDMMSASIVASKFEKSYGPEIHHEGDPGYYPHYHPWDRKSAEYKIYGHPHIWFLP